MDTVDAIVRKLQDAGLNMQNGRVFVLGSDHAGVENADAIKQHLRTNYGFGIVALGKDGLSTELGEGNVLVYVGTHSGSVSCDYPVYGGLVALTLIKVREALPNVPSDGIVICGTGNGILAAVKKARKELRCSVANSLEAAYTSGLTDVIGMGGRPPNPERAKEYVNIFLQFTRIPPGFPSISLGRS